MKISAYLTNAYGHVSVISGITKVGRIDVNPRRQKNDVRKRYYESTFVRNIVFRKCLRQSKPQNAFKRVDMEKVYRKWRKKIEMIR